MYLSSPLLVPLGDRALLIRFATRFNENANAAAISLSGRLRRRPLAGVLEIVPNLVSVLVRYDPARIAFAELCGEIGLNLGTEASKSPTASSHTVPIAYGGAGGPDLETVATALALSRHEFIAAHSGQPLRVLAVGFAPGFVYCGIHPEAMKVPRRTAVHPMVPAGSVLFAAGQTAIAATPVPTGWSVIGHTDFVGFDPDRASPCLLQPGDVVNFEAAP